MTAKIMTEATRTRLEADLSTLLAQRMDLADELATIGRGDEADMAQGAMRHDDLARLDDRIAKLRAQVADATIITAPTHSDVVASGTIVALRFAGDADAEDYLVSDHGDRLDGLSTVSTTSPLGRAILGHRSGDNVVYTAPSGEMRVLVEAVTAS